MNEKKKFLCENQEELQQTVYKNLYGCFREQKFCDVTLLLGRSSQPIKAHKVVLACANTFFKSLLEYEDEKSTVACLQNFDSEACKMLVEYLYIGKIEVTDDNIEKILEVADYLNISALTDKIEGFLLKHLCEDNISDYFYLADHFHFKRLREKSLYMALELFPELIYRKDDTLHFSVPLMLEILLSKDLFVPKQNGDYQSPELQELCIFKFILKYIDELATCLLDRSEENAENNRKFPLAEVNEQMYCDASDVEEVALRLLKCVHLQIVDMQDRDKLFANHQIKDFVSCQQLMEDISKSEPTRDDFRSNHIPKFFRSKRLANGGQMRHEYTSFHRSLTEHPNSVVVGMKIFAKDWYGTIVLSGLIIKYNDGETPIFGSQSEDSYEFELDDDERIIEVRARHGYLLDSLSFLTNKGRIVGSHGGDGGGACILKPPKNRGGYLAAVNGVVVNSGIGWRTINKMQLTWCYYGPEVAEDPEVGPEIMHLENDNYGDGDLSGLEEYISDISDSDNELPW